MPDADSHDGPGQAEAADSATSSDAGSSDHDAAVSPKGVDAKQRVTRVAVATAAEQLEGSSDDELGSADDDASIGDEDDDDQGAATMEALQAALEASDESE